MIRINSVKLNIGYTDSDIRSAIFKRLRIRPDELISFAPVKLSLDARKKEDIFYVMSLDVSVCDENRILSDRRIKDVCISEKTEYKDPLATNKLTKLPTNRPIIIGFGPAGIFASLMLARAGLRPLVFERGSDVDQRVEDVEEFWKSGKLDTASNVQFGEGGAGTFSDGKLNSMIHDNYGRISKVYSVFIEHGADKSIAYTAKPHIGTDRLRNIVRSIREEIISLGGDVNFRTTVAKIAEADKDTLQVTLEDGRTYFTNDLILAIGHSARDTFSMLKDAGVIMEQKPFAVGMRVQHPQEVIGRAQYGEMYTKLPAADYKLTYTTKDGRGVYSFCMCPGGFVVNASSENECLAVNGMSNSSRDEVSANSAIVVSIGPKDFGSDDVLAGMYYQRRLEHLCFIEGQGKIPVQYLRDFINDQATAELNDQKPNTKGEYVTGNMRRVLPDYISDSIIEAFPSFGRRIKGFDEEDTLLLGLESRTSSPVRIVRNDNMVSAFHKGLYPCGEGAGYAGGITSAAVDGIKVYEAIMQKYSE